MDAPGNASNSLISSVHASGAVVYPAFRYGISVADGPYGNTCAGPYRLRDKNPVEGIAMGVWQATGAFRVGNTNRHLDEVLADDVAGDIRCDSFTTRQSAQAVLCRDFPSRGRADSYVVRLIGYRTKCRP